MTAHDHPPLYFIQPHIIARLESGQFVARRQKSRAYPTRDRRNILSPLNITRRAIRYEPLVFDNRKAEILQAAQALNQPAMKVMLVGGPPGCGKTAFVRGLAEMMGGGQEQLLWFDVSRHTDFDEIIRFLIEYLTFLGTQSAGDEAMKSIPGQESPLTLLGNLLERTGDFPVLLVIDNMEHLVTPDRSIRSRELKEMFNFLLGFANVKLVLAGRQLPYADMNPVGHPVHAVSLGSLSDFDLLAALRQLLSQTWTDEKALEWQAILSALQGDPLLLHVFSALQNHLPEPAVTWQARFQVGQTPEQVLLDVVLSRLEPEQQRALKILSMVRHGGTPTLLKSMLSLVEPALGMSFDVRRLGQGVLAGLFKKVYPPQLVLERLKERQPEEANSGRIEPYYQLVDPFQALLLAVLAEEDMAVLPEKMADFYLAEKNKPTTQRLYPVRSRHLMAEAQYHLNRVRKRRTFYAPSEPDALDERPAQSIYLPTSRSVNTDEGLPSWPLSAESEEAAMAMPKLSSSWQDPSRSAGEPPLIKLPPVSYELAGSPVQTVRLAEADLVRLAELMAEMPRKGKPHPSYSLEPHVPNATVDKEHSVSEPDEPEAESKVSREHPVLDLAAWELVKSDERERDIQRLLQEALDQQNIRGLARGFYHLGYYRLKRKGQAENGLACLAQAEVFARQQGMFGLLMRIHGLLGHYRRQHFQHNQALTHLRLVEYYAGQLPESESEPSLQAQAFWDRGEIYFYRKQYTEAAAAFQRSLALKPDDAVFQARVGFRLALVLDASGSGQAAVAAYTQCVRSAKRASLDKLTAAALYNLASLYYEAGRLQEAREALTDSLRYDGQAGTAEVDRVQSYLLQSKIAEADGQLRQAQEAAQTAYAIAQAARQPGGRESVETVQALLRLADLAEQSGDAGKALAYYQQAAALDEVSLSEESRRFIQQKCNQLQEE